MNGNPCLASGCIVHVAAAVLREALSDTCIGRSQSEYWAVRVGSTQGAVVRVFDGLALRARFNCDANAGGIFLLPPQTTDLLAGVAGDLEIAFERIGSRGRVRILAGQTLLLDHGVADRRLANVSLTEPPEPQGIRVPAGPLAYALRRAREFVEPGAMCAPEHSVVCLGPLPGTEDAVVLARDNHSLMLMQIEGLGAPSIRIPVAHLDPVVRFLGRRNAVKACATGSRFALVDDDGSAVAWQCAIDVRPALVPPQWKAVTIDRDALLAAIDRLLPAPRAEALRTTVTLEPGAHRLTLSGLSGRGEEAVDVIGASPGPTVSASVRLTRLRAACDTASRQVRLHLSPMCVATVDGGFVNGRGRSVQRAGEGNFPMIVHRVVATTVRSR